MLLLNICMPCICIVYALYVAIGDVYYDFALLVIGKYLTL